MKNIIRIFIVVCLFHISLFAGKIETFYGCIDVEEPVLIELIESPAFQRLKSIHQYGVAYYTTHHEEYNRYEHSLGVFNLLRTKGCSLEEQIAGLLHDVSHTIFSHVGDWIFKQQNQETDYQTLTHGDYLYRSGLSDILNKYGYTIEQVLPKQELFPALEGPLPGLCADRIDYNIQGAFYQGYITHDEALQLFQEIQFIDGEWISYSPEVVKKLVRFSLFMSQDCWGSPIDHVLSTWLAEAILQGVKVGAISMDDIRFGIDQDIWDRLLFLDDPLIKKNMTMILNQGEFLSIVSKEEADFVLTSKFRGINPIVEINGVRARITAIDPALADEYQMTKDRMANGWGVKVNAFSLK